MSGFQPMLRKELLEFFSTWRVWLLWGTFSLFALIDPLLAKYTPQILQSVLGDLVALPPTTYQDAYLQWFKDLSQLLMLIVLAITAGSLAGEFSSGTLQLPLTKPLGRPAVLLAKFSAILGTAAIAASVGTAIVFALTRAIWADAKLGPLVAGGAVWFVLALVLVALTILASSMLSSTIAALGVGFGAYVLLGILGMWGPARNYSPAGLTAALNAVATGESVDLVWPVATGYALAAVLVGLAIAALQRREI